MLGQHLGFLPAPTVVRLNVGGTPYKTLLSTLVHKIPASVLAKMFDGVLQQHRLRSDVLVRARAEATIKFDVVARRAAELRKQLVTTGRVPVLTPVYTSARTVEHSTPLGSMAWLGLIVATC